MRYNKNIKGKVYNYFRQRLKLKKSTKGYWRSDCFLCGGDMTMGINFSYSNCHCFKCEEKITLLEGIKILEKFEQYSEVYRFLSIQQEYEYFEAETKTRVKKIKQVTLPESFRLLDDGNDELAKSARNYLKGRGFKISKLVLQGVGFCDDGEYFGYIIFPYYRNGELVYFQGRQFLPFGPKMKNPKEDDFGIGKSNILFNGDALFIYNRIHVVESITNGLTIGPTAVGLSGKDCSDKQFSYLLASPAKEIIIALDPDAYVKALELGMKLVNYKKVKVVRLPTKWQGKDVDVNVLGKKAYKAFVKSTPWMTYMDLFRLKLSVNGQSTEHTYQRGPYQRNIR